jgi:hypothetical protein
VQTAGATTLDGRRIAERERGRFEITRVPSILKERGRRIGRSDPVLDRYGRVTFEGDDRGPTAGRAARSRQSAATGAEREQRSSALGLWQRWRRCLGAFTAAPGAPTDLRTDRPPAAELCGAAAVSIIEYDGAPIHFEVDRGFHKAAAER